MLKNFANVLLNQTRNYAFKSKLKIKWTRPEKLKSSNPRRSGETEPLNQIPDSTPGFFFSKTEGIKDADENVMKLCSVGHRGKDQAKMVMRWQLMERVKRHQYDHTSKEVNAANLTARIRILQDRLANHPYDHVSMQVCKELVDKRKKLLKYIRRWDYRRFEWLLEKLGVIYKNLPMSYNRITRKESLVKLTNLHCDDLKNKKMAEYRADLLKQREQLLKEFEMNAEDRKPYRPDWCPTDIASQLAEFKEIPDPESKAVKI